METFRKYDTMDSTNCEALRLAMSGAPEGTIVFAKAQTDGKGRAGRNWVSLPGEGAYFSVILRPCLSPEHMSMLTLVMAHSIARVIPDVRIKWPNDLVIGKRKLGGILTEYRPQEPTCVIVGVGVNLNHTKMPVDTAISLRTVTGCCYDPETECRRYAEAFFEDYKQVCEAGSLLPVKAAYEAKLVNRNRRVRVLDPKGVFEGTATGIDLYGRLIVDGQPISSGEVSVRGTDGYF